MEEPAKTGGPLLSSSPTRPNTRPESATHDDHRWIRAQRLVSHLAGTTPSGTLRVSTGLRFTQWSRAVKKGVPPALPHTLVGEPPSGGLGLGERQHQSARDRDGHQGGERQEARARQAGAGGPEDREAAEPLRIVDGQVQAELRTEGVATMSTVR